MDQLCDGDPHRLIDNIEDEDRRSRIVDRR